MTRPYIYPVFLKRDESCANLSVFVGAWTVRVSLIIIGQYVLSGYQGFAD